MNTKVIQTVKRHQMLRRGDRVLVAFSGGADSMALLDVLYRLKDELGITVSAAHFNHKIRGEEAERDRDFCIEVCRKMGVEIILGEADIPSIAKEKGLGLEECGRQERYAFFAAAAPNALVATAHTLSDCEETFLFNLSRGSALKGLCSIPPKRGNIIRPIIDCSRAEIEEYCRKNRLTYVTDSTNLTDEYSRNFLRLNIIPQLKKLTPSFDKAFSRALSSIREDEALLDEMAQATFESAKIQGGFLTEPLEKSHPAVKKRAVAKIIFDMSGVLPQAHHIDAVCSILGGGETQVCGDLRLRVKDGALRKIEEPIQPWETQMHLGLNELPCGTLKTSLFDKNDKINTQKINKRVLANVIDYAKIDGKLFFTSYRSGDKIKPLGRGVTKQLRKLFNEASIPSEQRNAVAILRDKSSVVWVQGIGVDESCAADENTKQFLIIENAEV